MMSTFNMLYRLFAPFLVVILMIMGVQLSSGLIQNSGKTQTALSVAYACTGGVTPVTPTPHCTKRDHKGNCIPMPCQATSFGKTVPGFYDPAGCCRASGWAGAESATGGGGTEALKGMMEAVSQFFQQKPESGQSVDTPDTRPPAPVCKSISVSPTLPLRPGESATISWVLDGGKADMVIVSPGAGAVRGFSTRVSPRTSTTYTVTARNERGSTTCKKVRVHVGPGKPNSGEVDTHTAGGSSVGGGDDVDIWSGTNDTVQGGAGSVYDDVFDNKPVQSNNNETKPTSDASEDADYYKFLSGVASESTLDEPTDYAKFNGNDGEYYYGADTDNTFADGLDELDGAAPSWDSIDVQGEGGLDQADASGFDLDTRADYYDAGNLAYYNEGNANTSGLTNEEIYGVWSRAQTTTSGGLGGGGFGGSGSSDTQQIAIDAPQESQSIFARIGRWFKNVFCFWCSA